jgi:probable HAF family extracellular repeat protein
MRQLVLLLIGTVAFLAVAASGGTAPAAEPPAFTAVDLGTLGGPSSYPTAISDNGQVVGASTTTDGGTHAFSWTQAGGMVDLGHPWSEARAVNENGQVVGISRVPETWHAFSWTQEGGMIDLGTLGNYPDEGGDFSEAWAVNERGQVVGTSSTASGSYHAFSWTQAGGMIDLGTLGTLSYGYAVNDSGQVAGVSETPSGDWHAFSWTSGGGMVDLGSLECSDIQWCAWATAVQNGYKPVHLNERSLVELRFPPVTHFRAGQVAVTAGRRGGTDPWRALVWTEESGWTDVGKLPGAFDTVATTMNNRGDVAGYSEGYGYRAFLWTQAGGMVDLGTFGGTFSSATAINDSGQVVGWSTTSDDTARPFVWTQAGGMIDLGTLGGAGGARDINERGQVVGSSTNVAGQSHATLWLPAGGDVLPGG